jgi:hypothetical protein
MAIIHESDLTSPTIENALGLIDRKAETLESWRIKGLGLRLVLMGLAEVQALRLSRLAGMVYTLEEELFDPEKIRTFEPKMLIGLYQMSSKALSESSEFVERTLKGMDWSSLETELLQVKAQETTKTQQGIPAEDAGEILALIARMKAVSDRENGEKSRGK